MTDREWQNNKRVLNLKRLFIVGVACFLCLVSTLFTTENVAQAAKDTKKPKVKLEVDTDKPTNSSVTITVTAEDASGIKSVKWEKGYQKASYFKEAGTKLRYKKGEVSISVTENDIYSFYVKDKAGNYKVKRVEITNIDTTSPVILSADYTVMNQKAEVMIQTEDNESGIDSVYYVKGKVTDPYSEKWNAKGIFVSEERKFYAKEAGNYSILSVDKAGNRSVYNMNVTLEMRAVWISYLEFTKSKNYTETEFMAYVDEIYDNCANKGMNTVIVQVRPFSDAMYKSKYFPWSSYASGELGKDPGYDPFEYLVYAAHKRGLEIHAWINPYRITASGVTDILTLPENHPARKWKENEETERNVLTYGNALYYNPSSKAVQTLIVNGIKEIVQNYDVDGIHFDDYFYPSLGSAYKTNFDAAEYNEYAANCEENGKTASDIVEWRRNNINKLIKRVYTAVKNIDSECVFGISPHGNIDNLTHSQKYYVDVERWLTTPGYIDYLCPQLYWGPNHETAPFGTKLQDFLNIRTIDTVNIYVGLAVYKGGANLAGDPDWKESDSVIADEVIMARETGLVDGFILYRYEHIMSKKKEMENLINIMN